MAVVAVLPGPLAAEAGGRSRIELPAAGSVAAVLDALFAAYPSLRLRVLTEQGQIRPHVNVFVATHNVKAGAGLAEPVPDGTEVFILPAISGG